MALAAQDHSPAGHSTTHHCHRSPNPPQPPVKKSAVPPPQAARKTSVAAWRSDRDTPTDAQPDDGDANDARAPRHDHVRQRRGRDASRRQKTPSESPQRRQREQTHHPPDRRPSRPTRTRHTVTNPPSTHTAPPRRSTRPGGQETRRSLAQPDVKTPAGRIQPHTTPRRQPTMRNPHSCRPVSPSRNNTARPFTASVVRRVAYRTER
jgi:hypothetical protein